MYITIITFMTTVMMQKTACFLAWRRAENKRKWKGNGDAHEQNHISVPRQPLGGYAGHGPDGGWGPPQCLCGGHHPG